MITAGNVTCMRLRMRRSFSGGAGSLLLDLGAGRPVHCGGSRYLSTA